MRALLIRDCDRIVTMDEGRSIRKNESILIRDRRIVRIGAISAAEARGAQVLDGRHLTAIPGLVQTHIHLCQTAFRNTADDRELLDWLSQYIWPGESRLDAEALRLSARMGIAELLLGGTTTILDMATIRHTNVVFEALEESGMRAICGKCLMDDRAICPPNLVEDTARALNETEELLEEWHGRDEGRLGYAVTPRFAVSCTTDLMKRVIALAEKHGLLIHTHASENRAEIELVRKKTGLGNIEYFENIGLLSERACLAHCVHLEEGDMERLRRTRSRVLHCPSSNLKLASGIAPIPDMLAAGVSVSIGADGAPCNNLLDGFEEMRLAALIHKPRFGPRAMPAEQVFALSTIEGARALGLADITGAIKPGLRADIVLMDLRTPHALPSHEVYSTLVYSSRSSDVRHVVVDGRVLVKGGKLTGRKPESFREEFAAISKPGTLARAKGAGTHKRRAGKGARKAPAKRKKG